SSPWGLSSRVEWVDCVDVWKPPEAAITCVDDADAILPAAASPDEHRAPRCPELDPDRLRGRASRNPPFRQPCGRAVDQAMTPRWRSPPSDSEARQDGRVGDDSQIAKQHRPEQVNQLWSCGESSDELPSIIVNGLRLIGRVDKNVGIEGHAHPDVSRIALTASLSSRSTWGRPRSLEIHARRGAGFCSACS